MIQNTPGAGDQESDKETGQEDRYLPARMINEFVYCPRLFYLMHVEGQFEHNTETTDGGHVGVVHAQHAEQRMHLNKKRHIENSYSKQPRRQ